jgi:glycerophosphoryl diester phosphodiesterase
MTAPAAWLTPASLAGLRKPEQDKPLGALGAIRTASRTTWRQPQFYFLTAAVMQLFLVLLAVPLLRMLYALVLVETNLGSVAYDQILTVLQNPLADLTLFVLAGIAVMAVTVELTTLFVLAAHHQAGDSTSFRLVLRQVWWTIRKILHPQGLLILVYLLLLLPLGQLGLSSALTKKIGVPPFISEELHKSATTSWAYTALLVVLIYVNLRLILTLPLLATTSASVWQAFVTSWRLTRWRTIRIAGMLIVSALLVVVPAAILFGLTLLPTVITDRTNPGWSAGVAAAGRGIWQFGVFLITAQRTILIVQGLVALLRNWLPRLQGKHQHDVHEITYSVPSTVTASRRRKLWIAAAAVTVLALGTATVVNHGTMTRLAAAKETDILAHRGFVSGGVENTLPAMLAAHKAGADRVEFDVLQTKDRKFVVMHDAHLGRLAGMNVEVKDLTQAELMKITVRANGMEAKIPSLEEWIALSIKLRLPQLLEIKLHGGESPDVLPRLLAVLDARRVTLQYTYQSIDRRLVEELKRLRPQLVVGFVIPLNFGGVPRVNADFLVVEQHSFDTDFRNEAWGKGYKVIVWTVNDEQAMRGYISDSTNGLITDRPDLGVAARDAIENADGFSGRLVDMVARSSSF